MNDISQGLIMRLKTHLLSLVNGGFFYVMIGGIAIKTIAFISSIVIVRLLTKEDYAIIAYVDNIYGYITLLTGLGFATGILKYCVSDDYEKNRAYFKFALKWGLLFQIGIAFVSAFAFGLLDYPFEGINHLGMLLVIYPCVNYIVDLLLTMMRARLMNREYAIIGILNAAFLMALSVLFVYHLGPNGIAPARYIAAIACIIVASHILKKEILGDSKLLDKDESFSFVRFSLSLLVANLFSMIIPFNESFLVNNIVMDSTITADFKVAILIPMQITFITSVIMLYFTPRIAKMKPDKSSWRYSLRIEFLNIVVILLTAVIGALLTPTIISIAYGESYLNASDLSRLMWFVYGANAAIRMVPLNVLPMLGYTKFNLVLSIISSIFHFAIDAALIVRFGAYGAAYAGIVVYVVSGCLYWIYLYRKTMIGSTHA